MRFVVLWGIELKLGIGVGGGPTRFESIFSKRPFRSVIWPPYLLRTTPYWSVMHCWGQRSCRGQLGVKLLRNALWQPNLVDGTPDQSVECSALLLSKVMHGQLGSTRVKLLRNALWLQNLVGSTPDQSVVHWWGSKVMQGSVRTNYGSNCSGMPYGYQIWYEEPLTIV